MTAMYRALAQGKSAGTSLRAAKLEMLNAGGTFADPYYWAAFVVIGNGGWRSDPLPPSELEIPILAFSLFVAVILVVGVTLRRRWPQLVSRR
jgi:hypothetical protein